MGVVRTQNMGTQKYFLSDALKNRMHFPENIIFEAYLNKIILENRIFYKIQKKVD